MKTLQSFKARTGEPYGAPLLASTPEQVDATIQAASDAFVTWQASGGLTRGLLFRALADAIEDDRSALVSLADEETALGPIRLNGELDRTAFQLRRFADMCLRGVPFESIDDPAVLGAPPVGHPAMALQRVPLGPVAMFSASNFPFAFSVLGGDTASALAAGCSVVVKAHTAHLLLSNRIFGLIQKVLEAQKLPSGLIGMIQGGGSDVGVRLIRHPLIAAGAFTGSTRGGAALQAEANSRQRPIPFYGELGSINPLIAMPALLTIKGTELATTLAASINQGCGQFCTSPGVIVLLNDPASEVFIKSLTTALKALQPHAMLTPSIRQAFDNSVAHLAASGVKVLAQEAGNLEAPRPFLAQTDAANFIANAQLREEVFGPAALIVKADSIAQVLQVLQAVGGSLTVTLWGVDEESLDAKALVRGAMSIAGRVLFAGVPTGVAVTAAQQHGGPWPSSTQPMTTSVGDTALNRFLRPVCIQDAPAWLLARHGQPC
jgi:NADP-dependent aldehyde dehydrogenase